jgi:hypothetical protein
MAPSFGVVSKPMGSAAVPVSSANGRHALLERREGNNVPPLRLKRIARLETEFLFALATAVRRSSGTRLRSQ